MYCVTLMFKHKCNSLNDVNTSRTMCSFTYSPQITSYSLTLGFCFCFILYTFTFCEIFIGFVMYLCDVSLYNNISFLISLAQI